MWASRYFPKSYFAGRYWEPPATAGSLYAYEAVFATAQAILTADGQLSAIGSGSSTVVANLSYSGGVLNYPSVGTGRPAAGAKARRKKKRKRREEEIEEALVKARREGRLVRIATLDAGGGGPIFEDEADETATEIVHLVKAARAVGVSAFIGGTKPLPLPPIFPVARLTIEEQVRRIIADATKKARQRDALLLIEEQDEEETIELLLLSL